MLDIFESGGSVTLGKPELICRWRLAGGRLPLENRHLRALGRRRIEGDRIDTALVAWAKQHIEWTLQEGAAQYPDGVLMIIVDEKGQAAMTVGPYEGLAKDSLADLARRARHAQAEGAETGVEPESLWAKRDGVLYWDAGKGTTPSGAASLVEDLARTLGIPLERREGLLDEVQADPTSFEEAFLVSDEYGIVVAGDAAGEEGARFATGYDRLLQKARNRR